ncbi:GntR family transcriptional regulator [Advenella mimigardefordensis]|nr:GntR family transcriptional regulator [Advenella mimigardefordensis]
MTLNFSGDNSSMVQKIRPPKPLTEEVHGILLEMICNGTLKEGERITQDGLAEMLGVSRQPITQSIAQLKSQGFISDYDKKGVMVSYIDATSLIQMYHVRAALDSLACREISRKFVDQSYGDADKQEGINLLTEGRLAYQQQDISRSVECDMNFHQFLYHKSGNPVILESTKILWFHMRRLMRAILTNNVRPPERVWDEHEAIWHAAYTGSIALAEELAKKHAEEAAEKLARIFLEQNKGETSSISDDEIRYW